MQVHAKTIVSTTLTAIGIVVALFVYYANGIDPKYMIAIDLALVIGIVALLVFEMPIPAFAIAALLVLVGSKVSDGIVARNKHMLLADQREEYIAEEEETSDTGSTDTVEEMPLERSKQNDDIVNTYMISGFSQPSAFSPADFSMI